LAKELPIEVVDVRCFELEIVKVGNEIESCIVELERGIIVIFFCIGRDRGGCSAL
jgi:hypothetical protein